MWKYLFFLLPAGFWACSSPGNNADQYKVQEQNEAKVQHPGKKLFDIHCKHCHSATAAEKLGRVAPTMAEIKAVYLLKYPEEQSFISAISTFSQKPDQGKTLLPDAVKAYGLMPWQSFPEGSVEAIAEYVYQYIIDEPEWFKGYMEKKGYPNYQQQGKGEAQAITEKDFETIGMNYATQAKEALGKTLLGGIQSEGTLAAIQLCNVKAIPLTDSIAQLHQATIKRVSDRNRNPDNAANAKEAEMIAAYQKAIDAGMEPEPVVESSGKSVQFYYPITTNTMCLQCHGEVKNIAPEVYKRIIALYPMDKATGYAENQVRGLWSINFKK